mmetsp:Transcript_52386/g.131654  ORF Transcript_52386/g.131654 Transcript_52386/m.131654 type:complete len:217 (+) Transcript_52386:1163-1813(+)
MFKGLIERLCKDLIVGKRLFQQTHVLVTHLDEFGHEHTGGLSLHGNRLLGDLYDLGADITHVCTQHLTHEISTAGHTREEVVHALQILDLVLLEHRDQPASFHLDQSTHVCGDQLSLDHLTDLGLGERVEVVLDAFLLLAQPRLHLTHVIRTAVAVDETLTLHRVEGGRGLQEMHLELSLVDGATVDAQVDQHVCDAAQQRAIDHLALPFAPNQLQ